MQCLLGSSNTQSLAWCTRRSNFIVLDGHAGSRKDLLPKLLFWALQRL